MGCFSHTHSSDGRLPCVVLTIAMSRRHPLVDAADGGDYQEVERLLNAGQSPDTRGHVSGWGASATHTALMAASWRGHNTIVELLIEKGASLDLKNSVAYTALMYSCDLNHTHTCRVLCSHGADLDLQNHAGDTALHIACYRGHSQPVSALLEHGARTDIKNKAGRTAVEVAQREKINEWQHCVDLFTHEAREEIVDQSHKLERPAKRAKRD
eukprot:TRINITY_DN5035_c0_g2_i3.p1 TRINITY_DN5035_c0_g2~~TRINITY_DN5035_c0_g2_i3.p1  ORF type:complete len:212 (+),score=49.32 TRINITY_DN5035_c0_g2_i3:173-808(+)